jgi:hypothetical protein
VARCSCRTKSVSANTHYLKSVASQSRELVEPFEMDDSEVDITFMPADRDGQDIKCRVWIVAIAELFDKRDTWFVLL